MRSSRPEMVGVVDVAEDAGVSTATVSRVLAGGATVTAETRARVLASVERLGYRPNTVARALRSGRGRSVALATGDVEQGIYARLAKHLQGELERRGLDLVLFDLGHRPARLIHLLQTASSLGLRGILLASPGPVEAEALGPEVEAARNAGVAVLSLSQDLSEAGVASVVHDEAGGALQAVRHLLERGREPIAFLGRVGSSVVGRARFEGYRRALAACGGAADPDLVLDVVEGYRGEAGYRVFSEALARGLRPGAVLAASDELALGAMAAALDRGLPVPDRLAVVGFGGLDWGRFTRPALTTVALDVAAAARTVGLWFDRLAAGQECGMRALVPPRLVPRGSS